MWGGGGGGDKRWRINRFLLKLIKRINLTKYSSLKDRLLNDIVVF